MSYRIFTSISIILVKWTETKKARVVLFFWLKKWLTSIKDRQKDQNRQVKTEAQGHSAASLIPVLASCFSFFRQLHNPPAGVHTNRTKRLEWGPHHISVVGRRRPENSDTKKKKQTLVTYRQKKIAPHCLVSGWERINGPPINKITKKGNGHNIRDFPLWNGPLPALLGKSCFMSKLSPPHHHMHHLSPLFQHISDPNSNVNSHFSHRQGRMRSVCVCVCVCVGVGVCVCVFRRRGWRGLVVPWRTCGTTNEQCLEQYQRCRWEEIWMACQWRRWLLLMSVVETMSALGHLSLSLELFFLSYPGVSR